MQNYEKIHISIRARRWTTGLCVTLMLVAIVLDYYNAIGTGFRNSIPPLTIILSLVIIWCWKDDLNINELTIGGIKIQGSTTTDAKLEKNVKISEELLTAERNLEGEIKSKILEGYNNSVGTLTVENVAVGLNVQSSDAKKALDSLYNDGLLDITKLPTDHSERIYILKNNVINKNIDKTMRLLSKQDNILISYKLFQILNLNDGSTVYIDALIEAEKYVYVVIIQKNESDQYLIDKAIELPKLINRAYSVRPNKPIKSCIALTKSSRNDFMKINDMRDIIVIELLGDNNGD